MLEWFSSFRDVVPSLVSQFYQSPQPHSSDFTDLLADENLGSCRPLGNTPKPGVSFPDFG